MPRKTLAIVVYGADRQLWSGPQLQITLTDLNQDDKIPVLGQIKTGGPTARFSIDGLVFDSGQTYGLAVDAPKHHSAWQIICHQTFLRTDGGTLAEHDDATIHVILVPYAVASTDLCGGYQRLIDQGSTLTHWWELTAAEYDGLSMPQQMALLNIAAKLENTIISTSTTLMSYVIGLRHVDPDRLFLLVRPELKSLIAKSPDFAGAAGHGAPEQYPELPAHPDSWKHQTYPSGNIQLSFAAATEPFDGPGLTSAYSLDCDIDLARDLGHAWEWLDNNVIHPGKKTNQAMVYMLLFGQSIEPLYTIDETDPSAPKARVKRGKKGTRP